MGLEVGSSKHEVGSTKLEVKMLLVSLKKILMQFKFEGLIIWQKAMELGEEVDILSDKFPSKEVYNLSSQIRRAGDSIALNISEGSIVQSGPEHDDCF